MKGIATLLKVDCEVKRREKQSPPIRRILCRVSPRATIIPLGRDSHPGSSHLPAASPSQVNGCLFDVAPRRDCPFHPCAPKARKTRLCCSDPHLTVGRCYLLRCSVESGRSSRRMTLPAIARRTLRPHCSKIWGNPNKTSKRRKRARFSDTSHCVRFLPP
jgi:hypothetical protein